MKKAFLVLSVIVLVVCTISAGGKTEKSQAPQQPITLSLWGGWPEIQPVYEKVAADYTKLHPNVTIKILTHPLREFEQKLSATIPADQASDIIEASPYPVQKFIAAGLLPPAPPKIVEYMTKAGRFPEALVQANKGEDGKYYGLNYFQGRHAIFWNTDMFKEAGLPGAPKTMDELISYAQKLAKRDAQGNLIRSGLSLRLSGGGSGVGEKFWMFLYPFGGSIIDQAPNGKWKAGYNNEAGFNTLKMYIDMVWKYKTDDHKIKHDAEAFQLQQTAMFARESWVIGDTKKKAPALNYDTAPMPRGTRWGDLSTGVNLYVSRSCKNPDTAWDFILFLNSDENLRYLLDTTGWLPQRMDADLKASLDKEPRYKAFLFSHPDYKIFTYPTLPEYDEILTKFAERMVKAFLDSSLVDNPDGIRKVLADAAAETNAILKRAGKLAE